MIAKALDAEEAERTAQEANAQLAELETEPNLDAVLASLEEAKAQETRLQAEAQQQQELLDTLAAEFETITAQLTGEQTRKVELETQLQQSEQLKADLKSAYDASSSTNQTLTQLNSKTQKDLVDAGNNAARLKLDIGKRDEEIEKLNGWVTQLQADLQSAIALAAERNNRLNELQTQIPPPPAVFVEEVMATPAPMDVAPEVLHTYDDERLVSNFDKQQLTETPSAPADPTFDPKLGFSERYFSYYNQPVTDDTETGDANFGTEFPSSPKKGDVFLRVDFLPSRLFKWNNNKWIEIDKSSNDRLAYNSAYIEHLIEKIRSGEYDIDDVNDAERAEIEQFLKNNGTTLQ
jgi:hypothetical protein